VRSRVGAGTWLALLFLVGAGPARESAAQEPRLPSGPAGPVRFGAYATTLAYSPAWDAAWPAGPAADVVVRFGAAEPRLVFWRGAGYVPAWASFDGPWFSSGFFERRGGPASGTTGMAEPMSDELARYSHVRILENSDARVVVHWRYAPVDLDYGLAFEDAETGWGDWADEVYTIYPDAVAVRSATLRSSALDAWLGYQETIVIHPPGRLPEDGLEPAALTLANREGASRRYVWSEDGAPELADPPVGACIESVGLRSGPRPFSIVDPEGARFASHPGHAPGSRFDAWNHWPAAQGRSDATPGVAPGRPAHTSLSHVRWPPQARDASSATWVMLHGMSDASIAELAVLARSWLDAPELRVSGAGCTGGGYDRAERAYRVSCDGPVDRLELTLLASERRPLLNPAFVIAGWGAGQPRAEVDRAAEVRLGARESFSGADLVVWLRLSARGPVRLTLEPSARAD